MFNSTKVSTLALVIAQLLHQLGLSCLGRELQLTFGMLKHEIMKITEHVQAMISPDELVYLDMIKFR